MHAVFDIELIGTHNPVMLVCVHLIELKKTAAFWWHRDGDMDKLRQLVARDDITWVGFNSYKFDLPILSAALQGFTPLGMKELANVLTDKERQDNQPWMVAKKYGFDLLDIDHIDLFNVAPGVMISLKTYMGRMGYRSLIDMPFHHTHDLNEEECKVVELYCRNDIGGTKWLFERLQTELDLRITMGKEYGLDLRSKSDAQIAEAIFKSQLSLKGGKKVAPHYVTYTAPAFIQTDSPIILELIERLENERFFVNRNSGQPMEAEWMEEPIRLGQGLYKFGLGGLHSQHDIKLFREAKNGRLISDIDAASYYPKIILMAKLVPDFGGMKGSMFIDEYTAIFDRRIAAKRAGNKKVAGSLKIVLNGTFGKLGSIFSALYAPELLIATTITGQLNLMCLIHDLEQLDGVVVLSANTDGIMVDYPEEQRDAVMAVVSRNAMRTGFEYEETRYSKVAMKDVNNYLAVCCGGDSAILSPDGNIEWVESRYRADEIKLDKSGQPVVKSKGLYAEMGLMKNPTMEVCSKLARDYLVSGTLPEDGISQYNNPLDYTAIRVVDGGGIQYDDYTEVDDWVKVMEGYWKRQAWLDKGLTRAAVKRKSRPKPAKVGVGGEPFGRLARWYMTTQFLPPLSYVRSGNQVPKTEGGKVCMTLPTGLPEDLDLNWYIEETRTMLKDMGVMQGVAT